jgi:acyl-CoA synthetase (NDP forming)
MAAKAYFEHHRFVDGYRSPFLRPQLRPSPAAAAARRRLARQANGAPGTTLSEQDSKALLAAYGIATPKERVVTSASEAVKAAQGIKYPVVMKVASADIAHKSDLGLVQVGVRSDAEVRAAYKTLTERARKAAPKAAIDGVLVAEQASGIETVVGIARDELFGPIVMFGLGGVFVEVLKDVTFRVPPFSSKDAATMLDELAGAALLRGVRGQAPADRRALIDVIMKVQRLAVDLSGSVAELDVNPLIVGPKGAIAADALVVLG